MTIPPSINADIVDIRSDQPKPIDRFFVDTNVWFWLTYSRSGLGKNPPVYGQSKNYPNYVKSVLKARATLYRCGLSFAELSHVIEKTEREIYENSIQSGISVSPKDFRHNHSTAHASVITEIENAWSSVQGFSKPLDLTISELLVQNSISQMRTQFLDGYDVFILELLRQEKINLIITDDADFAAVQGITVFTAHDLLIKTAKRQNKLRMR